jgi:hypothetical protein
VHGSGGHHLALGTRRRARAADTGRRRGTVSNLAHTELEAAMEREREAAERNDRRCAEGT